MAPDPFDLIAPSDSFMVDLTLASSTDFSWQAAGSSLPNDTMTYLLEINSDPTFTAPPLVSGTSVELTTQTLTVTGLPRGTWVYWHVTATNRLDSSTVSTTDRTMGVYSRGDLDQNGAADVADLTMLIDHLFISFATPDNDFFVPAGNLNCQGTVDVADLTALIDMLFISFNIPACP
ncbi:MAG: hypothetical protein D6800_01420 [Candidatus Zixiibacteriota bacterium]|nr:MAG: hypothetical protein D6800_01420 [candidate division Zixibacteria bacterium]